MWGVQVTPHVIMAKKRNITPNRAEYNKQVKRIRQFVRRAEKRGFSFDIDIPNPKRVTKQAIERLKSLTPEELYKKGQYIDPLIGQIMSGTEGRTLERQRAAQKGLETKRKKKLPKIDYTILRNVKKIIGQWSPNAGWSEYWQEEKTKQKNILSKILDGAISQHGEANVAKRLQNQAEEVVFVVEKILYDSKDEEINYAMARFASIVKGGTLDMEEAILLATELDTL